MTQRERFAFGTLTEAAPRPVSGLEAPPRTNYVREAEMPPAPVWEDVFLGASPEQQQELLDTARRQRVLYSHQLPRVQPRAAAIHEPRGQRLQRLLSGQTSELESVLVRPLELCDTQLDANQTEAVLKALHTPDLFLLQGLPGTGKSRVAAEVITQAAIRGERVLLAAPSATALDHMLQLVAGRSVLCPIRCLDADESPESLPPSSRALIFSEQLRRLSEEPMHVARQELARMEVQCRRRRDEDPIFAELTQLVDRQAALKLEQSRNRESHANVASVIESEIAASSSAPLESFAAELMRVKVASEEQLAKIEVRLQEIAARRQALLQEVNDGTPRLQQARHVAQTRQQGRWWTVDWWRAGFQGALVAELPSLEARAKKYQDERDALEQESNTLAANRKKIESDFQNERAQRVAAEIDQRRHNLDSQADGMRGELAALTNRWQAVIERLAQEDRPDSMTVDAIDAARARWQPRRQQDEQQCAFAKQWLNCLETSAPSLPARLIDYANLVAATVQALPADKQFGDHATPKPEFDLLVLEEADQITKSDFVQLAARARRWMLLADAQPSDEREAPPADLGRSGSSLASGVLALRPAFFQGLWKSLHSDPRSLPYRWFQEGPRLGCRLRTIRPEQRAFLESERVADRPEIELRILTQDRSNPLLAEVVFPSTMSIVEAKQFIFQELDEFAMATTGSSLCWIEEADKLLLCFGQTLPADAVDVTLKAGVHEMVSRSVESAGAGAANPWATVRIEFDRNLWKRSQALAWVKTHCNLPDTGRTALLEKPYRMALDLAGFVSDVCFAGAYRVVPPSSANGRKLDGTNSHEPSVEFICTTPMDNDPKGGRRSGNRPARPIVVKKGGAGLELDLADRRHRDRLPSELRPGLPDEGFVNYLEARAVVRKLEALARELAAVRPNNDVRPTVGVFALYQAQVTLIRQLVQQSPALANPPFELAVDVPEAWHQRECSWALLSLTRSHTHRAVSFGESPNSLALAMTRARKKLILFGDPGTLARRSQWEESLDHLNLADASRERDMISRLVGYLEGRGMYATAFQLSEGGPA